MLSKAVRDRKVSLIKYRKWVWQARAENTKNYVTWVSSTIAGYIKFKIHLKIFC